ncbi:hypothetical protein Godav_023617 [Gossypium davidsonii]|uniref:Uncharacterized protein n=1 Tax=Gossypium davidsonii TaxID=34287 RepID=A0A7J8STY6_GOSDV|nr:hypothetical protein [Gossypium davidsonii]
MSFALLMERRRFLANVVFYLRDDVVASTESRNQHRKLLFGKLYIKKGENSRCQAEAVVATINDQFEGSKRSTSLKEE